jgi:ribosome-associated protein
MTSPSDASTLAIALAQAADEQHGTDTVILYVGDVLAITEYFVITSAGNRRLVRSIAEEVEEQGKVLLERAPLRIEGMGQQEWVLLDYGDVVVHVFADETRRFYEIERLYKDAPRLAFDPIRPDPAG